MTSSAKGRRAAIRARAVPTPPAPTRSMRIVTILTRPDGGNETSRDTYLLELKSLPEPMIYARTVAWCANCRAGANPFRASWAVSAGRSGTHSDRVISGRATHGQHHHVRAAASRRIQRQGPEGRRPRPGLEHRDGRRLDGSCLQPGGDLVLRGGRGGAQVALGRPPGLRPDAALLDRLQRAEQGRPGLRDH